MANFDRYEYENLTNELDKLLKAQDVLTAAQIDAGACRTKADYQRREEKQEAFYALKDAFEAKLKKLMTK